MLNAVKKMFTDNGDGLLIRNLRRAEQTIAIQAKRIEQLSTQRIEPIAVLPAETQDLYTRIEFLRDVIQDVQRLTIGEAQNRLVGAIMIDDQSKV